MLVFMHVAFSKMTNKFVNTKINKTVTLLANIMVAICVVANFSYLA